jgi:di/tricarboxylate transporter
VPLNKGFRVAPRRHRECRGSARVAAGRSGGTTIALTVRVTNPQILFLVILAGTLALFMSERVRIDVAAMMTVLALALTGILTPNEALSGFSSEPAIIVASVFVISAALSATGLAERIGTFIARASGSSESRAIIVIMPAVALLAAFSHHVMVTAMMLPIVMRLAREQQLPASRLLMPMSLAASLGTTLTLFSAPAFLLANNMLERQGKAGLGIFDITPIGAALVVIGVVYMSLGRWLLPRRTAQADETDYLRLDRYYTELIVEPESPWIDKPITEFQTHFEKRLQIVEWLRDGVRHRSLGSDATLRVGDVLIVRASPDELASMREEPGLELHAIAKYGDPETARKDGHEPELVQVIVAPNSPYVGRTIGHIDFLRTLGVVVVGLWRREGWLREEISQIRLREGDILVLRGDPRTFADLVENRGFLMFVPFEAQRRRRNRAALTLVILGVVITSAATGVVPTQIAFLAGAVALVITRCVGVQQAYREIDVRIFVMIAGVVPLGAAMEKTGTAALLAGYLQQMTGGWSPFAVLLTMFWAGALLTQILSDSATTVLLGPIALALAVALGLPPQPFVVCTALGAVVAFLTPIGHHGNLLILNPGQYRFGDFLRVGVPLTILISLVSTWLAQWLWLSSAGR